MAIRFVQCLDAVSKSIEPLYVLPSDNMTNVCLRSISRTSSRKPRRRPLSPRTNPSQSRKPSVPGARFRTALLGYEMRRKRSSRRSRPRPRPSIAASTRMVCARADRSGSGSFAGRRGGGTLLVVFGLWGCVERRGRRGKGSGDRGQFRVKVKGGARARKEYPV